MNFKFTPKSTAIFIAGLIGGGVVGAAFDSSSLGLVVVLAVVAYLANSDSAK